MDGPWRLGISQPRSFVYFSRESDLSILTSCCRLTPAYGFMILAFTYLPFYIGQGPMMVLAKVDKTCIKNWWSSLLYVNTIFEKGPEDMVSTIIAHPYRHFWYMVQWEEECILMHALSSFSLPDHSLPCTPSWPSVSENSSSPLLTHTTSEHREQTLLD